MVFTSRFALAVAAPSRASRACRIMCTTGSTTSTSASDAAPSRGAPPAAPTPRRRPTQGELVEAVMAAASERLPPIIDNAVNLTDRSFEKDRAAVMERARRAGVEALVSIGCCLRSTQAALELSDTPGAPLPLYFTAGVHPHNASQWDAAAGARLRKIAAHPRCVAVGECGLDFNRNFSPPAAQEACFAAQVALAAELDAPLMLHCRDAGDRFIEILRQVGAPVRGVLHCFTGNRQELEAALALGLHIGITGWICDERPERGAAALAALLPAIPDNRLLVETDAPYLVPRSLGLNKSRPSRNEPALLPAVVAAVAAARGQSPAHVASVTTANAKRLFGI